MIGVIDSIRFTLYSLTNNLIRINFLKGWHLLLYENPLAHFGSVWPTLDEFDSFLDNIGKIVNTW